MVSLESKVNQLTDENAALTRIITQLKAAIYLERRLRAQVDLEERIANLPPASQERLRRAFPDIDLSGSEQAVKVEKRGAQ